MSAEGAAPAQDDGDRRTAPSPPSPSPRGIKGATVVLGDVRAARTGDRAVRVADADEDVVTLIVKTVRRHLARTGRDATAIGDLRVVADLDRDAQAVVAEALGREDLPIGLYAPRPESTADALLSACAAAPEGGPVFLVAVTDGRIAGTRPGTPDAAGAVLFEVADDGPLRLVSEAHVREAREEAGQTAHLLQLALTGLGDAGTRQEADVRTAYAHVDPREARALYGREVPSNLVSYPVEKVGDLGHVSCALALVEALAGASSGRPVDWVVPAGRGVVAAAFTGEVPGDAFALEEAYEAPARTVDRDGLARLASFDPSGQGAVAQGAFISLQQYLAYAPARYRLVGQHCTACDRTIFPPRASCPGCAGVRTLDAYAFSGKGRVFAKTRIGTGGAPTEFADYQAGVGSYDAAIVALDEGPRVAAMLTGPDTEGLAIDDGVAAELRLLFVQDGVRRYGFKFRRDA